MIKWSSRALLWSPVALTFAVIVLLLAFPSTADIAGLSSLPIEAALWAFVGLDFAFALVAGWHVVRRKQRGLGVAALAGAAVGASPCVAIAMAVLLLSAVVGRNGAVSVAVGYLILTALMLSCASAFGWLGGLLASRWKSQHAG